MNISYCYVKNDANTNNQRSLSKSNIKNNRSKTVSKTEAASTTPIKTEVITVGKVGKWQKKISTNTSKYDTKE